MSATEPWPLISATEALDRMKRGARGIDVRSEDEFARATLPTFANVPILNNEARHRVGLTYKERGQDRAIALGHELVDPIRETLVDAWTAALNRSAVDDRLVICWRGGLRSQIAAAWLNDAGVRGARVDGGYKAIRARLLARLEAPPPTLILSGPTGSGKTEVLRTIPGALDLEGLANHRGSAFGRRIDAEQPAQGTFENAVAFALDPHAAEVLVEDESALIGRLLVPPALRERITTSPRVVLEVPLVDRVTSTFREYVADPVRLFGRERTSAHLRRSLESVARKLGGLRTQSLLDELDLAFADERTDRAAHEGWITRLLVDYYDPMYAYGESRHARPVLYRGPRAEVIAFLRDRFRS